MLHEQNLRMHGERLLLINEIIMNINEKIALELNIKTQQVDAAVELLDTGATIPFISRYRKEVTGGLTDTQLRQLVERLQYLRELKERQQTILKSITEQNKLTPELEKSILMTESKAVLEDIYLPYKPKRRTKAQLAREAGLEPLAMELLNNTVADLESIASHYIDPEKGIITHADALDGAQYILIELFSENAELIGELRNILWVNGILKSHVIKGKEQDGNKFSDYFAYEEPIHKVPSHRALAMFRGQNEEFLSVNLSLDENMEKKCLQIIENKFSIVNTQSKLSEWLLETARLAWRVKLFLKLELELLMQLREKAEDESIRVFSHNLKNLLMASPAGSRITLGADPGFRTGVKFVIIDKTGKLLTYLTLFPHAPQNKWDEAIKTLAELCAKFKVELVSIGNGTASRETDKLITELKKRYPELNLTSIVVSEAGASVYSASEMGAKEFPDLDVSYRGAVSIARRLQDPLAELVKIEPKSIGVGQYQHDVNQVKLSRNLHAVIEDCVNAVGVDVNTASIPLLSCVSGLSQSIATNIVDFRNKNGAFKNRNQLKQVPRLGEKSYEQAAGFLRIVNGENPLDASAVHPEAYVVVERLLTKQEKTIKDVMGNTVFLKSLNASHYTDDHFGLPTVIDIFHELEKPGRDPRPEFKMAVFKEGIENLEDLHSGMVLEGVITNVANFGAFVDIGVHQDGLVHKSMLVNHFVKDPNDVVKVGQIVKVKVIEVDLSRKRIQLTMRLNDDVLMDSSYSKKSHSHKQKMIQQPKQNTLGDVLTIALTKTKK